MTKGIAIWHKRWTLKIIMKREQKEMWKWLKREKVGKISFCSSAYCIILGRYSWIHCANLYVYIVIVPPFFGFLFPSSPFTHDYYGIFGKERCAIYKFSPLLVRDELTTRARILTENKSRTKCSTAIRRHFIPHEKHPANVFLMRHLSCVNIYWWAYQVVFFASL